MKINWPMLPLKAHYFFFLGAMSPILPFIMVIVRQLGIPVVTQGSIGFVALFITVIAKPIIGAAADAFPKARKIIFICVLIVLYLGLGSICLLPSMYKEVVIEGQSLPLPENIEDNLMRYNQDKMVLSSAKAGECYISEAWDCMVPCESNGNFTIIIIKHVVLEEESQLEELKNISQSDLVYKLKGIEYTSCDPYQHLKFKCQGGIYVGADCPSLFSVGVFWVYLLLYIAGQVTYTTSNSITDAICMDIIGEHGDYGAQRAWGTVGWGIMAPISGLLIDWWSGDTFSKNYTPVIMMVMGLGILDLTISSTKLKVPKFDSGGNVWKSVGKVLKKPHVLLFMVFVIMNGVFDGIILSYVFILQEEMAKDTIYMKYITFIQGTTLAAQCSLEAPFMWIFSWFLKRTSAVTIMKAVLFLYTIRLFILALIGSYGPVWAILICELLNGPCYGLGYTAIIVQASNITPPGTSATIQSITNICYESIGYAISSLLGGVIYYQIGAIGIYYVFSGVAGVTFISYLISAKCMTKLNYKTTENIDKSYKGDAINTNGHTRNADGSNIEILKEI